MKRSTAVLCGVFLLVGAGAVGLPYLLNLRAKAAENEARASHEAVAAAQAAQKAAETAKAAARRPFEDPAMAELVPANYSRPASQWQANEKVFFEKILSGGKFDVLVVPFQVGGWAVDRSTRSIMTAELAMGMAQLQKVKIPDTFLVAKALGDGQRQFRLQDIYRLADAIGARRIVRGYAGHDKKGMMAITLLTQDYTGGARDGVAWTGPVATAKFENIPFGDEVPVIQAYESLLPQILKAVGVDAASPVFAQTESRLEMTALPPSPASLVESAGNPAQDAYGFLLYGALTPRFIGRTKEIFTEKAHLALLNLSPASPDYRALRARTYMALGLRIAAIKALGEPQTNEEKALLAALNGNLPQVREAAARETNPLKRLLQKLDENTIAYRYDVRTHAQAVEEAAALKLPEPVWPFIATRAFLDSQLWAQYNNAPLKMLLDYELPVKDYTLQDVARKSSSLADPDKVEVAVDLSVFNHGRQFIDAHAAKLCCELVLNKPTQLDYLELLQGIGHDNLMRRIGFLSSTQGLPHKALSFAKSIEAAYKGYPYFAVRQAEVDGGLSKSGIATEKEALKKSAAEHAINAFYWEQGQTVVARAARDQFFYYGKSVYSSPQDFYYADVPYRPNHWTKYGPGTLDAQTANAAAALKNATSEIGLVERTVELYRDYYPQEERRVSELLDSIKERFMGSPQRNNLFAEVALAQGDINAAQSYFRDNIKLAPDYWGSYADLGVLLLDAGDAKAAAQVFHSYTGFKKGSSGDAVGIANSAFSTGAHFYRAGELDLAKQFFKIASSRGTGSHGDLSSQMRLKLMAGDIQGAMIAALENAQRYQEPYEYTNYLGMLHASGQSREAWTGFEVLMKQGKGPEIWESALAGHHKAALSEAEVIDWVRHSRNSKSEGMAVNAASIYLMRFATTDRTPSSGLAQVIDELDPPGHMLGTIPRVFYGDNGDGRGKRVKSIHAYFAQSYRALKLKDFAASKSILDEAAAIYDFSRASPGPPNPTITGYLPYYAFVSAKAGDTAGVEKIMGKYKVSSGSLDFQVGFDYYLSKAVLAGAAGKNDEALQFLKRAAYHRPGSGYRPLLPQHTLVEISALVADMTGSSKIKGLALDWAQKTQKTLPWQSWPYAMEAKLTENPTERKRAIAMTFYLDPRSEQLSAFDKPQMEEAIKAFGASNPLLKLLPKLPEKKRAA